MTETDNNKWVVDVKGRPGEGFEISVLRDGNKHGKQSYGWIDEDKLLISSNGSASWSVTPLVFEKLVALAHEVAKKLNKEELSPVQDIDYITIKNQTFGVAEIKSYPGPNLLKEKENRGGE